MMILFGDITGDLVNYVYDQQNDNLTQEDKDMLSDKLYSSVENFAIQTCSIGVVTIITTYISTVLFSFSAVKQVITNNKFY